VNFKLSNLLPLFSNLFAASNSALRPAIANRSWPFTPSFISASANFLASFQRVSLESETDGEHVPSDRERRYVSGNRSPDENEATVNHRKKLDESGCGLPLDTS
jgi:hypothetical protein